MSGGGDHVMQFWPYFGSMRTPTGPDDCSEGSKQASELDFLCGGPGWDRTSDLPRVKRQ